MTRPFLSVKGVAGKTRGVTRYTNFASFFLGLCYLQLLVCKYGEKGEGLNNLVTCVVISCQIDKHGAVPDEESQGPSFLVMSCQGLETKIIARDHQYNSLFGTLGTDEHKVCE